MPIKLSPHAKKRIKERGIPKSLVYRTIQSPSDILLTKDGRKILKGFFDDRPLNIVVLEQKKTIMVISIYFERKKP